MAKTAVVNRRRRRSSKRRRRNYGAAAAINPRRRRRRRRNYGAAAAINPRRRRRGGKRRRNPVSPYASTGYRQTNPSMAGILGQIVQVAPAATLGVMACRFAVKQAGEFEAPKDGGAPEPTLWHAVAIMLGANISRALLDSMFGGPYGAFALVAGLGYGGDLFARLKILKDNKFLKENFNLQGYDPAELSGFQDTSALGSWTDSAGNTYVQSEDGSWQMAGLGDGEGQVVVGEDGTLYQLSGDGAVLAGFQQQSALGMQPAYSNPNSSFGYTP